MKIKIILAVMLGTGMQMVSGGHAFAQGPAVDVFMDGAPPREPPGPAGRPLPRGISEPEVIVRRAYEDILKREPDKEGMGVFRSRIIDDKWTEKDVRDALRKSPEYQKFQADAVDQIIRRAYQDVLGREADRAGLAMYRVKMMKEGWSERDVRSDLKKSVERRSTGGMTIEQAQQVVKRAYQSVLRRDPDPSGMSVYAQKVIQNRWSENDIAKELRNSPEFRNKHGK